MKLRAIAEAKSDEPIRDSANAIGDLIQYIKDNFNPKSAEAKAVQTFLQKPTARGWEQTKWVVDSAIKQAGAVPETASRAKDWAFLKSLTSPTVTASLYDVDPKNAKGTPLQRTALSKSLRDKLKVSLGPEGYISSLSELGGEVNDSQVRHLLKGTAKNGKGLIKAAEEDLPHVDPAKKF